jgi:DNA-binding transcriptional regulator YiaG
MKFGEEVKLARGKSFMSQQMFAKELGVSFTTVNRWENGRNEPNYKVQKVFHDFCARNNINFD